MPLHSAGVSPHDVGCDTGCVHPFLETPEPPLIIAHRGFVSTEAAQNGTLENTHAAFTAALAAGADVLETDVRLTRDGRVVLFHDRTLERLTGDRAEIASLDLHDLAERLADHGGLLTIEDALERFPTARWNIDVKVARAATPTAKAVLHHGERVLLTSFSDRTRLTALRVARETSAQPPATSAGQDTIKRLVTTLMIPLPMHGRAGRILDGIDALQVPERYGRIRIVTRKFIRTAHRAGVHVHVWTVNDPDRMQALADLGVDGIVTDRTDLANQTFRMVGQ